MMKLKDAVRKSVRNYYDGKLPEKAIEASGKTFIYTPDFFDQLIEDDKEVEDVEDAEV